MAFGTHEALFASDQAVICSGTATLEAAVIGTPFVLVYKAKWLDYLIGRSVLKLPFVGLANLIFWFRGEPAMHPELLQLKATAERTEAALNGLDKGAFIQRTVQLRQILEKGGAAKRVALMLREG